MQSMQKCHASGNFLIKSLLFSSSLPQGQRVGVIVCQERLGGLLKYYLAKPPEARIRLFGPVRLVPIPRLHESDIVGRNLDMKRFAKLICRLSSSSADYLTTREF